ncbi:MAG: MBL fold metallo-hydrolase [Defluviimonas sp.]|uniref:MBL fold metallo-hydrolase n=1 Tax=Albidovulum sp. TaxID=1872424 RepID=UPI002A2B0FA2|nr:MBL fold metallo-hydrolase [Defluviimonas sp.]
MSPSPPFDPVPGQACWIEPDIRRVLAPNPSPMTFRGTNSYLVGRGGGVAVIDPGPDDATHLGALLAALMPGERVEAIFVTHAHLDHSPLAPRLAERTGAPVYGFGPAMAGRSALMAGLAARGAPGGGEGVDTGFHPDHTLADGDRVSGDGWSLTALHTPGHFAGHLCFFAGPRAFSGDHVMGWASSLVSPPDGDMGAYMTSLDRLAAAAPDRLHPGHGAPVAEAVPRIAELAAHRRAREAAILAALGAGPATAAILAERIYTDTPPALLPAAIRNVFAHLIDMSDKNAVTHDGDLSPAARFHRL